MNAHLESLENEVSAWPHVTVHAHRFGGREFRFRKAEVGHMHTNGTIDIPFTRPVRDALLAAGLAEEHRWVPDSGWATFRIRDEQGLHHALWLMRLSYLRYALKADKDPRKLFDREVADLHLQPSFAVLLEQFVKAPQPAGASTGV